MKIMRRLLIYLIYDNQNIIDNYIGFFLCCMRPIADTIIAVCNMPYIKSGIHNLSNYADHIYFRENKGLDCGGFKDALCQFVGWEKLKEYDELILANDSFYGPFEDIGHIFSEMEAKKLDFWGLMKRGNGTYGMTGNDPEHILSFFYVFQSPLIHNGDFQDYWEEMPYYKDYMTVVKQYERKLTKHFADLGYCYDAYADTSPNESENPKNQFFQCDYLSYEVMKKRKFPFLKRKQLSYNPLFMQTQENLALSIEYVDQYTDYDINLIWENLIRVMNPAELQRSLGLQFILEDMQDSKKYIDILLCVRAEWINAIETVNEYLEKVRTFCSIQIYSSNNSIVEEYYQQGFFANLFHGTDIELLYQIKIKHYRYLCFIHDCDLSSEQLPSCTGKSCFFNVWENLIRSSGYLNAIIRLFDSKPQVGMLMHPVPIFSKWIGKIGWDWEKRYDEICYYIELLELNAVTNRNVPPIHVTSNFWIRTEILQMFFRKTKELEKKLGILQKKRNFISQDIYAYLWSAIVQDYGQLTGIVESSFYASMNEVNLQYYFQTLMQWFSRRYGSYQKFAEFREIFFADEAAAKCREKHKGFYIYGTGECAKRCFPWLKEALAFIVSDGQAKNPFFCGKPVINLSELKEIQGYGIILCLSKENGQNVIELLKEKGIYDYYTLY